VVKVTGSSNRRVSLAALLCIKPGQRPRLIYRAHHRRKRGTGHGKCATDQRKGFTEADYARLLDAAYQQLADPLVLVWDNLNSHVSDAMEELIAARDWLTVYRLRRTRTSSTRWSPSGRTSSGPWPTSPSATSPSSPR
jgi:hypothetical protein